MSKQHVLGKTRMWSLTAVCAVALLLSGCLQSGDDTGGGCSGSSGCSTSRSDANGGYYASMLPTASAALVHALNAYVADKHTIPTGATPELRSLITSGLTAYGFDLTKMGSAASLMQNAYWGTHVIAWVDPSVMDAGTKATYVAELAKRAGESALGTVSADGKSIVLKDGQTISIDGCAPGVLKPGTIVLAYGITYPADMAQQAVSYNTRDVTCDAAGMTGYVGTATQRQAVYGNGTVDTSWTNYDTSKCTLGFKVGSTVSKVDVTIDSQNALLGGSVAALLQNAGSGVQCVNRSTTVEVEEPKKDADGKVVLDDKGNPVMEKVTKTINTCVSGSATALAAQATKTQASTETKGLNCGDGTAEPRTSDSYAGAGFQYDPAKWTGTFTAKRIKTVGVLSDTSLAEAEQTADLQACVAYFAACAAQAATAGSSGRDSGTSGGGCGQIPDGCSNSYSQWEGNTIACQRQDSAQVSCGAFTPGGFGVESGNTITVARQLIANSFANAATFTPAVQASQWAHTGGACTYARTDDTGCPAGSQPSTDGLTNPQQVGTRTITTYRKSYQNGGMVDLAGNTQQMGCYKESRPNFCPNGVWTQFSIFPVSVGGRANLRDLVVDQVGWATQYDASVDGNQITFTQDDLTRLSDGLFGHQIYILVAGLGSLEIRPDGFCIAFPLDAPVMGGDGGGGGDPLVMDLDGSGIDLTATADGVGWDITEDGTKDKTAWVRGNTALLAYDRNHDGVIDRQAELFGNLSTSGFDILAALDDNHDGVIDAEDAAYNELYVWQDANTDAVSSAGELTSLSQRNITDISLQTTKVDESVNGNKIVAKAAFTMNGVAHTIAEAWFQFVDGVKDALK